MPPSNLFHRLSSELGITTLMNSSNDVHLLLITRFIRMFAYGSSTLILALFFAALGHSDTKVGLFMTLTLIGDVLISLGLTLVADPLGRRKILLLGALLMVLSGIVFANVSNYWILLFAAVVGVISPSGNEIGPFRAGEESTLAHLTEAKTRSDIFALYVVAGTLGTAGGSLTSGWVTQELQAHGWGVTSSFRFIFWMYALVGAAKAGMTLLLSDKCEVQSGPAPEVVQMRRQDPEEDSGEREPFLDDADADGEEEVARPASVTPKKWFNLSKRSQTMLAKLCGLFFFDSLARYLL